MSSTSAIRIGLIAFVASASGFAQMQNNMDKGLTCQNENRNGRLARHCEIREQAVAAIGRLALQSDNGSVTVKGWLQSGVLVRARIDASADTESAAALLASKVYVDASGGQVRADGPRRDNNSSWSVSYEVFVPQNGDIELISANGSLSVSDVRGQIHFDAVNGSVKLKRVAGEVAGATVNGSIQVELAGPGDGRQMKLKTQNGSVTVTMPPSYSARVEAETNMGGIQSDFPMTGVSPTEERGQPRRLNFNIGAGGPLIHVTTGNGSVRFKRGETQ
jgi:DUF4097 and DUF4098 domain-containing protein YvlB